VAIRQTRACIFCFVFGNEGIRTPLNKSELARRVRLGGWMSCHFPVFLTPPFRNIGELDGGGEGPALEHTAARALLCLVRQSSTFTPARLRCCFECPAPDPQHQSPLASRPWRVPDLFSGWLNFHRGPASPRLHVLIPSRSTCREIM